MLLDEMFPDRESFPSLNKHHNLRHVAIDFKLNGSPDEDVVQIAKKEVRILVSKNVKHMIILCQKASVPLICITEKMTNEEIDNKIMAKLKTWKSGIISIRLIHSPRRNR